MMKRFILYLLFSAFRYFSFGQNPIVPPGVYIADPSAHVWNDGRLYVYGSRDESPDYYCSVSYRVLSSVDLKTWELSGESFATKGPDDQVSYSDGPLLAPDAARACLLRGNIRIKTIAPDNEALGGIRNGDKAAFKYLDFKKGADSLIIIVSPGSKPCCINLSLDNAWGGSIGSVNIPAKHSDELITLKVPVKLTKGVHALWLNFSDPSRTDPYGFPLSSNGSEESDLCQVDAFQFK
jgi:hypothetical protein